MQAVPRNFIHLSSASFIIHVFAECPRFVVHPSCLDTYLVYKPKGDNHDQIFAKKKICSKKFIVSKKNFFICLKCVCVWIWRTLHTMLSCNSIRRGYSLHKFVTCNGLWHQTGRDTSNLVSKRDATICTHPRAPLRFASHLHTGCGALGVPTKWR